MNAAETLLARSLEQPVPPEIAAMASHVRSAHDGVMAILAYGSCLRGIATTDSLIDLYVLTRDLAGVSANALSRLGCRLIPPNVYYAECDIGGQRYRAKYAVLPMALFADGMTRSNPYFWARFAQPTGLLWSRDRPTADAVRDALVQAILTTDGAARPLVGAADALTLWSRAFAESYRTELRAEKPGRAAQIVEGEFARYRRVAAALAGRPAEATAAAAARRWFWRRLQGKGLSLLRLAKASWTFAGGADYLAWKISRHAGVPVEFSPWERRHPFLAAPFVLWRLARRGAIR